MLYLDRIHEVTIARVQRRTLGRALQHPFARPLADARLELAPVDIDVAQRCLESLGESAHHLRKYSTMKESKVSRVGELSAKPRKGSALSNLNRMSLFVFC